MAQATSHYKERTWRDVVCYITSRNVGTVPSSLQKELCLLSTTRFWRKQCRKGKRNLVLAVAVDRLVTTRWSPVVASKTADGAPDGFLNATIRTFFSVPTSLWPQFARKTMWLSLQLLRKNGNLPYKLSQLCPCCNVVTCLEFLCNTEFYVQSQISVQHGLRYDTVCESFSSD